ncbi:Uncharacterized protein BP5553_01497 [Venustampulla echinocandica]|uniref:3-hydroxyacyl-CoA dehydrogenase n=1 Tax=Venustampulla echinocandica TaxID=2656787 RepID=A0A370U166_9HELO|nr:Uncharacterized protein BP5553_01497 [Venustampulla echinocandica]RDL41518.1 Uncharacterized protein BP5553_01497 [Venustampulla echinocandica]
MLSSTENTDEGSIRRVAVIGYGKIGASFAALFAANGLQTTVYDPRPEAESLLWDTIERTSNTIAAIQDKGCPTSTYTVKFTTDLTTALEGPDLVQENSPEQLHVKHPLLQKIDEIAKPSALICSSTSGGEKTSAAAVSTAMAFYTRIGKKPIHIQKEVEGHVANRLQSALAREIMYLLQEAVVSVADIDVAMEFGPGLRWSAMGPSMLWHLGGGQGGIGHYAEHLFEPLMRWYAPADPVIDKQPTERWVNGTKDMVGTRRFEDLSEARDDMIVKILQVKLQN